ncbi:MAG: TonB-dependent receptor [Bacteroidota bacterium]|nr:TonB-dependent receptor [Bacteroidota bacterium]
MKKKYYLLPLLLVSLGGFSQTDSLSIEEVVINENRFATPLSKQNRNVYVLQKEQIKQMSARTFQEVLQYANGVDLRQRGPFGTQADVSIDGGSFEQTVVLLNGVKIIDAQTAHNMLNLPIPVEVIERIEVIRGAAARVYGVNSLTGAINIITSKPMDSEVFVNLYAGSNFEKNYEGDNKTFHGEGLVVGGVLAQEKHQHSLFGSHDKSNGYRYNTGFENNKLYYQGNFELGHTDDLLVSLGYIKNDFGANAFYAAPGDKNSVEIVQTTLASIQSKHSLSDRWILSPRLSYRYNYDDYRYFGNADLSKGRSQHYANTFAAEINTTYATNKGDLGFGLEYRNEDINSSNIGKHNRENVGFYTEFKTDLTPKLNLNVGAYLNYNSDYSWQIYPGVDLGYAFTEHLKMVFNVGTSQRIPSFTDLYLDQRPGNIGNANLVTENAFQSEVGLKYFRGKIQANLNYFYRNIDNFIDWVRNVDSVPWQSNNVGNLKTNGINLRVQYNTNLSEDVRLGVMLAHSYLDSKLTNTNPDFFSKYAISSLKNQFTNTISLGYRKTSIFLATRYSERFSGASYWVNDLRLGQELGYFTIYADVQNIFNTTYYEVGAVPLPTRWVSLGVKFRI